MHLDDVVGQGAYVARLAKEYRKALQNRLSPPCGKVAGMFVHHTNVEDAAADPRRLVCYDCGVACDMTAMRDERIHFLESLGAKVWRANSIAAFRDALTAQGIPYIVGTSSETTVLIAT